MLREMTLPSFALVLRWMLAAVAGFVLQPKDEHVRLQAQPHSSCLLLTAVASALSCWMPPVPQPCMSHQALSFGGATVELPPLLFLLLHLFLPWSEPWVGAGRALAPAAAAPRHCPGQRLQGRAAMLHQEEEAKRPLDISPVFQPVFWWLEQGSLQQPWGSTLLHRPPKYFTHPYPGICFPRRNPKPGR